MDVYFILSEPFGPGQYQRHGLGFLEDKSILLRSINLLFMTGNYTVSEKKYFKENSEKNQIFCNTIHDVYSVVKEINTTDIVFYHVAQMHRKKFNFIIKYFNHNNIRYGFMDIMPLPKINNLSFVKKLFFFIESHSVFFQIVFRRSNKIYSRLNFRPSFIITAGNLSLNMNRATYGIKPHYFSTEHIDYRRSKQLDLTFTKTLKNKKYILFIEQGDPLHPDLKLTNTKFEFNTTEYYQKINDFILALEQKSGLEVIVGLPPKTKLFMPQLPDYFKEKQYYINKTPELAKYCQFVVAQYSTAISLAVIFKKPLLFFSLKDTGKLFSLTKNFARIFRLDVTIIDNKNWDLDTRELRTINVNVYNNFEKNWIKVDEAVALKKNLSFLKYLKEIAN